MGLKVVCSAQLLNHFSTKTEPILLYFEFRRILHIVDTDYNYDHSYYIWSSFIKLNLSSFDPIFGRDVNDCNKQHQKSLQS